MWELLAHKDLHGIQPTERSLWSLCCSCLFILSFMLVIAFLFLSLWSVHYYLFTCFLCRWWWTVVLGQRSEISYRSHTATLRTANRGTREGQLCIASDIKSRCNSTHSTACCLECIISISRQIISSLQILMDFKLLVYLVFRFYILPFKLPRGLITILSMMIIVILTLL